MFEALAPFLAGVATAAPQLSQNLAEGEIAVSHLAHVVARTLPQLAQNLAPFRFSVPQDEQRISADLFSMPSGSPNAMRQRRRLLQSQRQPRFFVNTPTFFRRAQGGRVARLPCASALKYGPACCVQSMRTFAFRGMMQPSVLNTEGVCSLDKRHVGIPFGTNDPSSFGGRGAIRGRPRFSPWLLALLGKSSAVSPTISYADQHAT
ncbi:hypothetical protein M2191_004217 [Bradyrhizobium japonicum]|nr:hypothetical protein [Bradyrhizobium japonicum]